MAEPRYPLEDVLAIKQRRVEAAEKIVQEKRSALETEENKLKQCEEERDKVLHHQKDKLEQLRHEMDHGTTSPKIQQMKAYLKVVDEKLQVQEKKVKEQKEQVEKAKQALEEAREHLRLKRLEVDKMKTHRKDWIALAKEEQRREEGRELDEIGNLTYLARKRQK